MVLQISNNNNALKIKSKALLQLGKYNECIKYADMVLATDPNDFDAL